MAGREELYLKHIDENTGRIAKALEYMVDKDKKRREQCAKDREEAAKLEEARRDITTFFNARDFVLMTFQKNGMSDDEVDKFDELTVPYWPKGVE